MVTILLFYVVTPPRLVLKLGWTRGVDEGGWTGGGGRGGVGEEGFHEEGMDEEE